MKLTRTDFSSLAAIAVGGLVGIAAFGPQNFMSTHTVVTTDFEYAPMRVVLPSGEAVPFDRDVMEQGVIEFRRDRDRERETLRLQGEPIIYVDGVRVSEMPDLDPDAIERVEVLKGPAAAALLGEEASNGVILIFLKTDPPTNPGG